MKKLILLFTATVLLTACSSNRDEDNTSERRSKCKAIIEKMNKKIIWAQSSSEIESIIREAKRDAEKNKCYTVGIDVKI